MDVSPYLLTYELNAMNIILSMYITENGLAEAQITSGKSTTSVCIKM